MNAMPERLTDAILSTRLSGLAHWLDRRLLPGVDAAKATRVWLVLLAAAGLGLWLVASAPVLHLNALHFDAYVPLDALGRMLAGQRPHIDWPTPLGWTYHLALLAGAWLNGPNATALAGAHAIAGLVLGIAALLASHGRMAPSLRAVTVAFAVLFSASPRVADHGPSFLAFLAGYNRWAAILSILAMLVALVPTRGANRGRIIADSLLLAVLLLACAYTKATFAVLAAGACCLGLLFASTRPVVIGGGAIAAAAFAFLAAADIGGTRAYLGDLIDAAHAQGEGASSERRGLGKLAMDSLYALPAVVGALFACALAALGGRQTRKVAFASAGVLVAALASSNQAHDYLTASTIGSALVVGLLLAAHGAPRIAARWALVGFVSIAVPVAGLDLAAAATHRIGAELRASPIPTAPGAIASRLSWHPRQAAKQPTLLSDLEAGAVTASAFRRQVGSMTPDDHISLEADALRLLHEYAPAAQAPATVEFTQWLAAQYGYHHPRGWPAWLDWGRTVSEAAPPRSSWFAETDAVLVPKPHAARIMHMREIAPATEQALPQAGFAPVAEGQHWILWLRRDAAPEVVR